MVDANGVSIEGVSCYIYEGDIGDNLPLDNISQTEVYNPYTDPEYEVDLTEGDTRFWTDVLNRVWQLDSTVSPQSYFQNQRGNFAFRAYYYGRQPVSAAFTPELGEGMEFQNPSKWPKQPRCAGGRFGFN